MISTPTRPHTGDVLSFTGRYRFLSNFWPVLIEWDDDQYNSVEHAYQAAKTMDLVDRNKISMLPKPGQAKKAGSPRGFQCANCGGAGEIKAALGYRAVRCSACSGVGKVKIVLRVDWELIKLGVMEQLLRNKFGDDPLRSMLLQTTGKLVEGNTWGDTFWGVCGGIGENHLGELLMLVREEFRGRARK